MALFPAIINIGGEPFPFSGKVISAQLGGATTITPIELAKTYSGGTQSSVAFIDRTIKASKHSGNQNYGFLIVHPNGSTEYNSELGRPSTVNEGDIILWGSGCSLLFANP